MQVWGLVVGVFGVSEWLAFFEIWGLWKKALGFRVYLGFRGLGFRLRL